MAVSTKPFEPHTKAVPRSTAAAAAISAASMRPVWPVHPSGASRVKVSTRVVAELVGVDHVVGRSHRVDEPHRRGSGIVRRRWRSIAISGTTPEPPPTSSTGLLAAPHEVGRERAADLDLVALDDDLVEVRGDLAVVEPVDRQLDLPLVER